MWYYSNWFPNFKSSLHSVNKPNFVMFLWYFIKDILFCVYKWDWYAVGFAFVVVMFSYQILLGSCYSCDLWYSFICNRASQMALVVKNLPANAGEEETRVQSMGQEVPLEETMATHSSILAWRIPLTEEPGGLQSTGSHRGRHNWRDSMNTSFVIKKFWILQSIIGFHE